MLKQTVRIIGGRYRGKKIQFPNITGVRPTPDRVRETLFNWLMHDIHGAHCLDAFAGSGALGFEAWSRGANHVTLVEQNPIVAQHLKKISQQFANPNLEVKLGNTQDFLHTTSQTYNIIFFDPPFSQPELLTELETIATQPILATGGLVYLETPQEIILPETSFTKIKLKHTGQVTYGLYRKT